MSDWTSNEAREFLSIIRGEAEKAAKDFGDKQSSVYACLAVVTNIAESGDISVRLLSSPSDGSQDFVVRNRSGSTLEVGDSVWLHYWSDYTNVYIAMRNAGDGESDLTPDDIGAQPNDALSSNLLINGGFDVWQRGTSQTSSGFGSDDRWMNINDVSTKTHSRQAFAAGQTDVPNNPNYYSRTVVSSGGTAASRCIKYYKFEDVTKLSGKTVTLSFWAKSDSVRSVSVEFQQNFGAGGSTGINAIGVQKFTLSTLWAMYTATVTFPSVSGKTIGANNLSTIVFWFDAGSDYNARTDSLGNQSGTFDIANVQLNYGSVALPFVPRSYADELRVCQRYYRSLTIDTIAAIYFPGYARISGVSFPVMRVVPTATIGTIVFTGNGGTPGTLYDANVSNGGISPVYNWTGGTVGAGFSVAAIIALDAEL